MHILIVSLRGPSRASGGGAQAYVRGVGREWVNAGHTVRILCAHESGREQPDQETLDGIEIMRVGSGWFRVRPLARAAARLAPEAHVVVENLMGAPLALPRRVAPFPVVPVVALKHHVHRLTGSPLRERVAAVLDRTVLPRTYLETPFVVPSERTARALRRLLPPEATVTVVPPPVGPSVRTSVASGAQPSETPLVLALGALHRGRKRVDDLLEAFRSVLQRVPDAELIVAGDGPDRARLESLARGLPVQFVGRVTEQEKADLFVRAWVLASPSSQEGFGMTWIEAGEFALPVVGYALDGLDTVDETCACMVPPGDVPALADTLTTVLTDADLRARLASGARANAERFSPEASAEAFMEVLQRAVVRGR